jgi:hypothetical protein
MPLAWVVIVVNSDGRAERCTAIGAAHEHHVGCASSGRLNACQHVNIIIRSSAGMIYRKKRLSVETSGIDSAANQVAAHINRSDLIKNRNLVFKLRIARTRASKVESFAADVEIAVAVYIKRSVYRLVRDIDRRFPRDSGIGRTVE